MSKAKLLIILSLFVNSVFGQYQIGIIPRVSPDKRVYQKVGYTEVEVRYGSPAVNGRKLWGELVPYDKVWRAGANSATTIEFSNPVYIDGKRLDSGKYSFFLIPKKDSSWTAIFNKKAKQWGAFKYDEKQDVLRLEVSCKETIIRTENLNYRIQRTGFKNGSIELYWGSSKIEVFFETTYIADLEKLIETRAEAQPDYIKWIAYLQGAEHLVQIGDSLELAKKWISQADLLMNSTKDWNVQFYPRPYVEGHLYWIKAKIMAWDKNYAGALESVKQLKALKQTDYYDKKNISEEIELHYEIWLKK